MKRRIAIVLALLGVLATGIGLPMLANRPTALFRKFIMSPIPAGVEIYHGESRLSHAVVFLHFSMTDEVVKHVLMQNSMSSAAYRQPADAPDWFHPPEIYGYWTGSGGTKELWFNGQNVYFKQVNP